MFYTEYLDHLSRHREEARMQLQATEKLPQRDKLVFLFITFSCSQLYNPASHKNFTTYYTGSHADISQDQEVFLL